MKDRIFLDTNILVYLSDTGAEFHATVKEIFKDITEKYEIWISRQILREYAVVVSRKEDVEKPLKPQEITNDIAKWEISFRNNSPGTIFIGKMIERNKLGAANQAS